MNARVDVVSYNSRDTLRACVEPPASAAFPELHADFVRRELRERPLPFGSR